jgi:UDP-N-acetylmuramoylalanine--D-glutamate ligase
MAKRIAEKGDTVLLSPACSFDLFENHEDRGNQFKKAEIYNIFKSKHYKK